MLTAREVYRRKPALPRRDLPSKSVGFAGTSPSCYVDWVTNAAVLVLNRHYQPIHVTNVKRAFSLLYLGVARVIDPEFKTFDFESWAELGDQIQEQGEFIHTVTRAIRIPRVIVL